MKESDYLQCKFTQGNAEYTAYISQEGARVGLSMELEGKDGRWKVVEVYKDSRVPYETAKLHERDYVKHWNLEY
jgi:hypothetical protein